MTIFKFIALAGPVVLFGCFLSGETMGQPWTHGIVPASVAFNKDLAIAGNGPALTGWYAELSSVTQTQFGEILVYYTNSSGVSASNGVFSGMYRRVYVPIRSWPHPKDYRSNLNAGTHVYDFNIP